MDTAELDAIPLLAGITGDGRRMLAQNLVRHHYAPGETIVPVGSYGYEFFLIEAGTATAERDGETLATLQAGDFFGEMAVLPQEAATPWGRRSAAIVARTPVSALLLSARLFRNALATIPEFEDAIKRAVATREERDRSPPDA